MAFLQFWLVLVSALAYFDCWYGIAVVVLWNIISYFIWDYEKQVPKNKDFRVCIVGAGFSGIGAAIKLKKVGIEYEIFEAAADVGGTWWSNVYPGCACDIKSHLYCLSSEPNPLWSRKFPPRKEIWQYMKNVADKNELKIRYNSPVESIRWDNHTKTYTVTTRSGETHVFNVVLFGAGVLREPVMPTYPGMDEFQGISFHSANWDPSCDVTNKRVAVIGTGASAVQIVPTICSKVDQLFVFQRTPCWSLPRLDREIPSIVKMLFKYIPGILYAYRLVLFAIQEQLYFLAFCKNDRTGPKVRRRFVKEMKKSINDPKLAEKLIPSFPPGCKRITPSDEYIPSFNRANVHLITESIECITKEGIRTKDGNETKLDIIVYATGYSPLKSFVGAFEVYNSEGESLKDVAQDNPSPYLGISMPNFPNFFCLLGPHTGLGHNSVVWMIECQITYITDCLRHMLEKNIRAVRVKTEKRKQFGEFIEEYMESKVFGGKSGCSSWYLNDRGVNYTLWPSHLPHYWWLTRRANLEDYHLQY